MIKIDQLTVTVTVEGEAQAGERGFARLFDKYSKLRDVKLARQCDRLATLAHDAKLPLDGRR